MKKYLPLMSIGIVIGSLGVAYYFIYFLPDIKQRELNFKQEEINKQDAVYLSERIDEKQEKCQKLGKEEYNKEINENSNSATNVIGEPTYHYNIKLDRCFYQGGIISFPTNNTSVSYYFVKDLESNEEVTNYYSTSANDSIDDFNIRSGIYMKDF